MATLKFRNPFTKQQTNIFFNEKDLSFPKDIESGSTLILVNCNGKVELLTSLKNCFLINSNITITKLSDIKKLFISESFTKNFVEIKTIANIRLSSIFIKGSSNVIFSGAKNISAPYSLSCCDIEVTNKSTLCINNTNIECDTLNVGEHANFKFKHNKELSIIPTLNISFLSFKALSDLLKEKGSITIYAEKDKLGIF